MTETTRRTGRATPARTPLPAAALAAATGGFQDTNGNDFANNLTTGDGMDKIFARGGDDLVHSGGGVDEVHAGAGNDAVNAGAGDDKVFGDGWGDAYGHDTLDGGAGSDELHGDAPGEQQRGGHDVLDGGRHDGAADKAFGGGGDDTFRWGAGDGNDEIHGDAGTDTMELRGVTPQQLQDGLSFNGQQLQMRGDGQGGYVFTHPGSDVPVTFSGTLTIGGETLRFFNMERIRLTH